MQVHSTNSKRTNRIHHPFREQALKKASKFYWNNDSDYAHCKKIKMRWLLGGVFALIVSMVTMVLAIITQSVLSVLYLSISSLVAPIAVALLLIGSFLYEYFCKEKRACNLFYMSSPTLRTERHALVLEYTVTGNGNLQKALDCPGAYVKQEIPYENIQAATLYEDNNIIEFFGQGSITCYADEKKEFALSPEKDCLFGEEIQFAFFFCLENNQTFLSALAAKKVYVKAINSRLKGAKLNALQINEQAFETARKAWVTKKPAYTKAKAKRKKRLLTGAFLYALWHILYFFAPPYPFIPLFIFILAATSVGYFIVAAIGWSMSKRSMPDELSNMYHPKLFVDDTTITFGFETLPYSMNQLSHYNQNELAFEDIEYVIHHQEDNIIEFFGYGNYNCYTTPEKLTRTCPQERRRFGAQYKLSFFLCLHDNEALMNLLRTYHIEIYER